jgi:hypothetical protein
MVQDLEHPMRRHSQRTDTTSAAEKGAVIRADRRYWLAVASADHARHGKALGIMQVCHGKGGPLRRIRPGDGVVYYSPTACFGRKDRLQAFTAIGIAENDRAYQVDMEQGFRPFRRDVTYVEAKEASILPLLDQLELTRGKRNCGYSFRFGLVEIAKHDFDTIAAAMGASL